MYGSQVSQLVACADRGIEVHLVVDGISSQRLVDRQVALKVSTTTCTQLAMHCSMAPGCASLQFKAAGLVVTLAVVHRLTIMSDAACSELAKVELFLAPRKCCSFS